MNETKTINRRDFLRVAGTLGASALLAACASPAAPTEVTSNSSPTSAPAAASAATAWAEGITIRYFVGGAEGDSYGSIKLKGAQAAAADLGCKGEYIFSGWDQNKIAQQMREAIAAKPDGIGMCWLGSDDDLMPMAEECKKAGILLDLANVDYPKVRAMYNNGYTGVFDLKAQGTALGKQAINTLGLKSGDHALVFGAWTQPNRFWREEGTALAFEEAGMKATRLDSPTGGDLNAFTPKVSAAVLADPAIRVIVYPGGQALGMAEAYMTAINKKPGEILNIGFDTSAAVMDAFKKGWVQLTADQQPFLQGYIPMLSLCLQKKYKMSALLVETGAGFVDTSNWETVATLATAGIR